MGWNEEQKFDLLIGVLSGCLYCPIGFILGTIFLVPYGGGGFGLSLSLFLGAVIGLVDAKIHHGNKRVLSSE